MPTYDPAHAAVGDRDRVALQPRNPVPDPPAEILVALAAAWAPAIRIGPAGGELLGIGIGKIIPDLAFPVTEVDFLEQVFAGECFRVEAHLTANDAHGIRRAHEWTGDEVEARVIKVDKVERRIGLSIKAVAYDEESLKKESQAFESLRPSTDLVGLEQAFKFATEEFRPGESK